MLKNELVENLHRKGVKKMKKLMIIAVATAMFLSLSCLEAGAGETAQLGLTVSFDQEFRIWSKPEGPFEVVESKKLEFTVIAEDLDTENVVFGQPELPKGAEWYPDNRDVISNHREGKFVWKPDFGQARYEPYPAVFNAKNSEGEKVELKVLITVLPAKISIELVPTNWVLAYIALGERVNNLKSDGAPMHNIENSGNVDVRVDIGYGPQIQEGVRPGLEQGKDTFITALGPYPTLGPREVLIIIPPNERLMVGEIASGNKVTLPLTYGAPTELSEGIRGHEVKYELRAEGI